MVGEDRGVAAALRVPAGAVAFERLGERELEGGRIVDRLVDLHPRRRIVGPLHQASDDAAVHGDVQHHRGDRGARLAGVARKPVPDEVRRCGGHGASLGLLRCPDVAHRCPGTTHSFTRFGALAGSA
jgi:hypothetical protein